MQNAYDVITGMDSILHGQRRRGPLLAALCLSLALVPGCSIKRLAVNKLGDALAWSGATFTSDDDPELVKAAVPFSLKLMESLLAESPKHSGLLFAASSGFTQYAYAFVQQEADEIEGEDVARAKQIRARATRLYLRARNYGLRALEIPHAGFEAKLRQDPRAAVRAARQKEVPTLYWTAVSWAAAISLSKDDPHRVAEIPQMEALIDRALELDEAYGHGAIHAFLIIYEMGREGVGGDPAERARRHFDRALQLSDGKLAGPFVAYAESVCAGKQDGPGFETMLNRALAIDADANPEFRLVNLVMQRRARWLLSKKEDLFLIPAKSSDR